MSKKILIIEDDVNLRANLSELLSSEDYEVLETGDGKHGIEMAKKAIPDLIICDIGIPQLDGFAVLKLVRICPHTLNIPFIFLTGDADRTKVVSGLSSGANDYLIKPFKSERLLESIKKNLNS